MSEESNGTPSPSVIDEIEEISDIDRFVRLLVGWHERRIKVLRHLQGTPVGVEMTIEEEDGTSRDVILEGDFREGFLAGLHVAIAEIKNLPFVVSVEDPDEGGNAEARQDH